MRLQRILTAISTLLVATAHAEQGKHLFILSGQSNMVGVKPGVSFTPAVEKEFGKERVIVVHDAKSGCPIRSWLKDLEPAPGKKAKDGKEANGYLYDRLMGKVTQAMEGQEIGSVTFIWMQGERDAKEGLGEGYAPKLRMLLDQLKADLKRNDIAFVIGRISDHGMKDDMKIPGWPGVREAQVQVAEADPLGAWTDTDDLNGDDDDLHYNAAGYAKLGERFAEQAIMLVKKRAAATKP